MASSSSSSMKEAHDEDESMGLPALESDNGSIAHSTANDNNDIDEIANKSWKSRIDISIHKSRKRRGSNYVQLSTVDGETCEPRCRTVVFRGFVRGNIKKPSSTTTTTTTTTEDEDGEDFGGGCVMKMITDARSSKVREVTSYYTRRKNTAEEGGGGGGGEETKDGKIRHTAELVWWFPKKSEQYRVRGQIQFIGSEGPLLDDDGDDIIDSYANVHEKDAVKKFLAQQRLQQWGNLSDMAREQFYWDNPGEPFVEAPPPASSSTRATTIPAGGRDKDGNVLHPPDTFLLMLLYPMRVDYLRLIGNFHQVDEREGGVWVSKRVNP